jgi:hypothetical protein
MRERVYRLVLQAAKDVGAESLGLGTARQIPKRGCNREDGGVSIFFAAEILKSLALATSSATRAND